MKRKWPIRLVQISPLLILLLAMGLWYFVPPVARAVTAEMHVWASRPDLPLRDPDYSVLTSLLQYRADASGEPYVITDDAANALTNVSTTTAVRVMSDESRLYDAQGKLKPLAIPASDEAFSALREYEAKSGARTTVFVQAPAVAPAVAMKAGEDLSLLTEQERSEFEAKGTLEALRHAVRGSQPAVLPVDVELGGSITDPPNNRYLMYTSLTSEGDNYEVYGVFPRDVESVGVDLPFDFKVGSVDAQRALLRTVKRHGGTIFVIGPINGELVPLLVPKGTDAEALATYTRESAKQGMGVQTIQSLTAEKSSQLHARYLGIVQTGINGTAVTTKGGRAYAKQPLVIVTSYGSNPQTPYLWKAYGKSPLHVAQVWLASNGYAIAAVLGVLFLGSLIASPLAFVYERRITQEAELERERERVRQEARDKVVERLNQLSEQVEHASARASEKTRREVAEVARDIDLTVADLRDILGGVSDEGGDR